MFTKHNETLKIVKGFQGSCSILSLFKEDSEIKQPFCWKSEFESGGVFLFNNANKAQPNNQVSYSFCTNKLSSSWS